MMGKRGLMLWKLAVLFTKLLNPVLKAHSVVRKLANS
jgi:hypothetical protein